MLDRLTALFDEQALEPALLRLVDGAGAGPVVVILAVLTAAGIGAVHAVGPGHGKALIGAYLAGTDGRRRDAVALGALVAAMHTASVLVLGLVLQATQRTSGGERLQPILVLVSAAAVTAVGGVLFARQVALLRARSVPTPVGGGAAPPHHRHHHDHRSTEVADHHPPLPDGVAPLSRAGVVALATSGGLLPSPAAFLVLATAMAMGRTGFGLALVGAFGVGLAVTLTLVGLAILWGRDHLTARATVRPRLASIARVVPLVASLVVLGGGVLLAVGAVLRL